MCNHMSHCWLTDTSICFNLFFWVVMIQKCLYVMSLLSFMKCQTSARYGLMVQSYKSMYQPYLHTSDESISHTSQCRQTDTSIWIFPKFGTLGPFINLNDNMNEIGTIRKFTTNKQTLKKSGQNIQIIEWSKMAHSITWSWWASLKW